MIKAEETKVVVGAEMEWGLMPDHWHLYHREIVNASQADELGVRVSSVLWEKIGVGGAVLPHYHDVAEIIHITAGQVKLLRDGTWTLYQAGDTFHVPAGVVHSVACVGDCPSEQISIFLPVETDVPSNSYFNTHLVEDVYTDKLGR
ncbi:cupin domain-containing protein [Cohnella ginsengisoli]|uniref:Cupin domain-containing protein n=1 Tax=Cohnella ginsengisoli TaxID=425004 RepID=A0A9X4KKB5_9BACL|nr:cupin domain-containing protein [Cohnella ginsengisoli]MDG0793829.1 cupin domain-containing protein [Cohnella ginsengisoli]